MSFVEQIRVRHGLRVDKKFLEGLTERESNELTQINRILDAAEEKYYAPIKDEERLRLNSEHKIKTRKMIAEWLSLFGEPSIDWNRPLKSQVGLMVNLNRTEYSSE